VKTEKLQLCLLISGGGTTMKSIIEACQSGRLNRIEPALVVASKPRIGGLAKAISLGVNTTVIRQKPAATFGQRLLDCFEENHIDIIGQYGWMPLTPGSVIAKYPNRMINQHPGPLDPGYLDFGGDGMYGRRVHAARIGFVRLTDRCHWTEATAQRVDPQFDRGPVLHRQAININPDDDPESLAANLLPIEHEVQIQTLAMFQDDKVEEQMRTSRLVGPEEQQHLIVAKEWAIRLYPSG